MNTPFSYTMLIAALGSVSLQPVYAAEASATAGQVVAQHAALPIRFEPNVGQSDPRVEFLARGAGYTLFLTASESVIALAPAATGARTEVVRMRFAGANAAPQVEGLEPLEGITNYFIGNDPAQWRTDIGSFAKVRYSEIYAGIDLVYYGLSLIHI